MMFVGVIRAMVLSCAMNTAVNSGTKLPLMNDSNGLTDSVVSTLGAAIKIRCYQRLSYLGAKRFRPIDGGGGLADHLSHALKHLRVEIGAGAVS